MNDAPTTETVSATTKYLSTTDRAAIIRKALKEQLGASSRDVSVRSDCYSMGSTIYVRIRSSRVSLSAVKAIAETHESVAYDHACGEILNGGNRFVDVAYTDEATAGLRADVEAVLRTVDATPGEAIPVLGFTAFRAEENYWRATASYLDREIYCWSLEFCARQIVEAYLSRAKAVSQ